MTALFFLLSPILGQHEIGERLPLLDKKETRKLLRQAEEQLTVFRKQRPVGMKMEILRETIRTRKKNSNGEWVTHERIIETKVPKKSEWVPRFAAHSGNPLAGRTCTFNVRFCYVMAEKDLQQRRAGQGHSSHQGDDAEDVRMVVVGELQASLGKFFEIGDIYPELAEEIEESKRKIKQYRKDMKNKKKKLKDDPPPTVGNTKSYYHRLEESIESLKDQIKGGKKGIGKTLGEFRKELKKVRHKIWVRLPAGYAPPGEIPKKFEVAARVYKVEWDENAPLPYFVVQADLIKSEDLGLNALGTIGHNE